MVAKNKKLLNSLRYRNADGSFNSFHHSVAFDSDYNQMFITDRTYQYIYGFTL